MTPWIYTVGDGLLWWIDQNRVYRPFRRDSGLGGNALSPTQTEGRMRRGVPLALLENK